MSATAANKTAPRRRTAAKRAGSTGAATDRDRPNSEPHSNQRSHVQTSARSNESTHVQTFKPSERPRYSVSDLMKHPRWQKQLAWYDNKIYAPIRKIEDRLRKEDERNRAEARALNLKWRLDAIDAEFNHICNQINGFVNLVMGSYGYHHHRGSWRRRRVDYNQRYLEDSRIDSDSIRFYLQDRATAPDPQGGVNCQFAPVSTAAPSASPTTPPSAASEGSAADSGNTTTASYKTAPLPEPSKLPFPRPFHPLFPRAMDGTTLMVPRPEPPERPDWAPYVHKRARRPSERQVRKLYEDFLLNDDPPPPKGASRYTDVRIFLAELTPLAWQRYGSYFYQFFKRRLPADLRKRKRRKKPM